MAYLFCKHVIFNWQHDIQDINRTSIMQNLTVFILAAAS